MNRNSLSRLHYWVSRSHGSFWLWLLNSDWNPLLLLLQKKKLVSVVVLFDFMWGVGWNSIVSSSLEKKHLTNWAVSPDPAWVHLAEHLRLPWLFPRNSLPSLENLNTPLPHKDSCQMPRTFHFSLLLYIWYFGCSDTYFALSAHIHVKSPIVQNSFKVRTKSQCQFQLSAHVHLSFYLCL